MIFEKLKLDARFRFQDTFFLNNIFRLSYQRKIASILCISSMLFLSACGFCGFNLRGGYTIPQELQTLQICPDDPFEPFQRVLRFNLKQQCIRVIECPGPNAKITSLILSPIIFQDRPVAYGSDVQVNRVTLVMGFSYEVDDAQGNILIPKTNIQVERDLTINPNAVLGTENERNKVKEELYNDATSQLIRQLSNYCGICPS